MADIAKATPLRNLTEEENSTLFEYFFRRLHDYCDLVILYAEEDYKECKLPQKDKYRAEFNAEIYKWATELLHNAWEACEKPTPERPELGTLMDTSIIDLPRLPPVHLTSKILNITIFLHLTSTKSYSAHTRSFLLRSFGNFDEHSVVETLKHPDQATREAAKAVQEATKQQADRSKVWRRVGVGAGALAGGVLIGVTGGLAAPLVGAGVSTVLGIFGIGGPIGLIATGLASSGAVCGALFGVYGAKSTAQMVARHTREVRDFAFVPVRPPRDSLAVRLCVSGWLSSPDDVTAPWTVFDEGEDTFALQWEVKALEELSSALYSLIRMHTLSYVKWAILRRTVFSTLMAALTPLMLLKIGQVVGELVKCRMLTPRSMLSSDNPWMNAKALAVKAGKVLGTLLVNRAFGNRPVSLVGYSLGSLVIVEALNHISALAPGVTVHLIQDAFLFGTPAPTNCHLWSAIRRVVTGSIHHAIATTTINVFPVAGRVVNGYTETDYVLAILSRTTDASWRIAGLHPVEVQGVENVQCDDVGGHLKWPGMVGRCLQICGADGLLDDEVERQLREVAEPISKEIEDNLARATSGDIDTGRV